jgi:hypothetical protein
MTTMSAPATTTVPNGQTNGQVAGLSAGPSGGLSGGGGFVDPAPSPSVPITGNLAGTSLPPSLRAGRGSNTTARTTTGAQQGTDDEAAPNSVGGEPELLPTPPRSAASKEEDKEHRVPDYLKEADPEGLFGIRGGVVPPVISA